MSTIHDLRATLEREAATVHDTPAAARAAAVRGRARAVRRRRAAAGAVAAALVVGGASAVALMPRGDAPPAPADGHRIGDAVAPESMSSLGWEYDFERGIREEDSPRVRFRLPASGTPTLISWSTDDGAAVEVFDNGDGVYSSWESEFGDFAVLPEGPARQVEVLAEEPGLGVALYTLDSSVTPPGVGEGAVTFRQQVGGRELLGAVRGDPGQASVEVSFPTPRKGMVWLATACEGVPPGVQVHFAVSEGEGSLGVGPCANGHAADPGTSAGTGMPARQLVGERQTVRMWLTREGERVADGELPGVRIGAGAYTDGARTIELAGSDLPHVLESAGHTWELADVATGDGEALPSIELPDGGPWLVTVATRGLGFVSFRVLDDGRDVDGGSSMGVTGSFDRIYLPAAPGRQVTIRLEGASSPPAVGLAVYGLADR